MFLRQGSLELSSAVISNENDQSTRNGNKVLPQVFFKKDVKNIVHVGKAGDSAFSNKTQPFIRIIPLCLFIIMKKPYIVYFMINGISHLILVILMYFKFGLPSTNIIAPIVELFLILICILFELIILNITYLNYARKSDDQ